MAQLRKQLISNLEQIPGVQVQLWRPDSELMVVNFKGKEVAHFHGNNEIDIRLSKEIVKRDQLTHDPNRIGHRDRKNGGRWLVVRFTRKQHLPEMERLVRMAIQER